jgi:hypothetical protein
MESKFSLLKLNEAPIVSPTTSQKPTSPPAASTSMGSHLLSTLIHQQITKIIYTTTSAQNVLAKLVEY